MSDAFDSEFDGEGGDAYADDDMIEPGRAHDIAVVGMAGRFPGAADPDELWRNVRAGVESVRHWTQDELRANGVPESLLADPGFVGANGPLDGFAAFDAEFFGLGPKEAAIMDPQHRQLLEVAWEALEDAGYPPERFDGDIGVFAGCGMGAYFLHNVMANDELVDAEGLFLLRHTGNDKDFLSTRISYALDLSGPSISVQTACSTSLVAIHQSCQSLLAYECDMALAGGVTIEIPHGHGYVYKEGEVLSPDGHCRAFDHRGRGTVFGSGAGMVVLRRLVDAVEDGDRILAVIKGSAVNNDGARKISYMAPSVDGQAAAIAEALAVADVDPASVHYVETHGTGTAVGDPIEVAALNQAFGAAGGPETIGIGSIKPNIGHLDTAAGVASFIKLVQAIRHRELPPSINYEAPNPVVDFRSGPFFVNDRLRPWPDTGPARGGVSSLGVGGTNAHVIVEEAPEVEPVEPAPPAGRGRLVMISGRNPEAVDANTTRLADHLAGCEDDLADVAYSLHATRRAFGTRRIAVATDIDGAIEALRSGDAAQLPTREVYSERASVAFLFPGGGAHHAGMGRGLYDNEPEYRRHIDAGMSRLRERHGIDLTPALFCEPGGEAEAEALLEPPSVQLPAIFLVEYALGKLYESWGIVPRAMAGHSLGENTAACLAGVMTFEDCLDLVVIRGAMMESSGSGGVLSVNLAADDVEPYLSGNLVVAGINGPTLTSVSGTVPEIAELADRLGADGVEVRRIPFEYPVHSPLFDPHLGPFEAQLRSMDLKPPSIPIASNLTGTWLTVEEATDPGYWVRQVRHTVRFADDVDLLLQQEGTLLVEVGPGASLSSFARQSEALRPGQPVFASLRRPDQAGSDDDLHLLEIVGRLWSAGLEIDPEIFHGGPRRRVRLPKYAFTHRDYFIEPSTRRSGRSSERGVLARNDDLDDWFQREVWREQPLGVDLPELEMARWLIFDDGSGPAERLARRLFGDGHDVVTVVQGDAFARIDATHYAIAPEMGREGYERLVSQLVDDGRVPDRVVHFWTLSYDRKVRPGSSWFHHLQDRGFASLVHLAQVMAGALPETGQTWTVVTNGATAARGPIEHPEKATLFGPVTVIPRELAGVDVSLLDLDPGRRSGDTGRAVMLLDRLRQRLGADAADEDETDPVDVLLAELAAAESGAIVAYRSGRRYRRFHDRATLDTGATSLLRSGGTYLVTGGLGGIGMFIADRLGRHWKANLVLVGRSELPPEAEWPQWLDDHGPDNVTSQRLRKLIALRDAGVEVMTAAADVADVTAMTRVVDDAVARFGRLDGVIHAAGVVDDGLIATRSEADLDRVLTPKIQGALVLEQVTEAHRPDFVVSFSSTSAALGLPGQVDYAAANAFLDAHARRQRRIGEPRRISLAWGPWLELGMAASASSEVLDAGTFMPSPHALLDYVAVDDDLAIGTAQLSADGAWVLDEHRAEVGRAVLPGTAHLELYAEMATHLFAEPAAVKDLTFVSPLVVPDEAVRDARVVVRRIIADAVGGDDVWKATLESGALGSSNGWHVHSEATLVRATSDAVSVDLPAVAARCVDIVRDDNGIATRQEDHIRFGPRWRCLHELRMGEREALGSLRLADAFVGDLDRHLFHAALADIATGFGLDLIPGYAALESPPLYVPFGYGSVTLFAPLAQDIRSHLRLRDTTANDAMVRFDITICDPSGRVLAEIEDFSMVRTESSSFGDTTASGASTAIGEGLAPDVLFERFLAAGIEPDDGWEAFQRVLAAGENGHVVVSPLPIGPQTDLITRTLAGTEGGARFARPALSSEYAEPSDEVEAALVDIWESLLGIDQIGVDDDFFELGGHSLVALRLFASVKSRFGVDHPMSVLFDAPTVARLAAVIRAGLGDEAGAAPGDGGVSGVGALGLRHVVEMSPDPGDGSTPFFLVAGMFGNILNLRHLAMLIGDGRAVYGIQALGLREGEEPHRRFEDMAEAYIAEIRRVQPHGPYLLGGFSGGGVTAFEMAHQIEAAGEKVDAVIMLDSPRPGLGGEVTFADRVLRHVHDLRVAKHRYPMHYLRNRLEWERYKRRLETQKHMPGNADPTERIEAAFYDAVASYEARPWSGRVELFRPPLNQTYKVSGDRYINETYEFQLSDNGWGGYAGDLVVHEVPGTHDSMVLEPNVRVLAARIVEVLAAAESGAS
ncbi:MAG: type I polyketide synthase [Acidimicrobiales bacterium]